MSTQKGKGSGKRHNRNNRGRKKQTTDIIKQPLLSPTVIFQQINENKSLLLDPNKIIIGIKPCNNDTNNTEIAFNEYHKFIPYGHYLCLLYYI